MVLFISAPKITMFQLHFFFFNLCLCMWFGYETGEDEVNTCQIGLAVLNRRETKIMRDNSLLLFLSNDW